jgi:PAS domain S-box-containing protein
MKHVSTGEPRQRRGGYRDIYLISLAAVLTFVAASLYRVPAKVLAWSREPGAWYAAELLLAVVILLVALAVVSIRRWIRLSREAAHYRRLSETLREGEEGLRSLFDNIPLGVYRTTSNGHILMANSALVRMLGYASFEELATRNLEKGGFEPSYPRQQFREILERDGKVEIFEAAWMRSDGQVIYVRENARAVRMEDGAVYYEGTVEDITERKRMLDVLRQSEREYRGLFEYAHDAIIIFDPQDEVVREVNQRACELYGFSREEFIGRSLEVISHDVTRGKSAITETLKKGDKLDFETVQYRKDGGEIFLEVNAAVVDYKGRLAILSVNRDITERRRMVEALRESEERFRTMADTAPVMIWVAGTDRLCTFFNKSWLEFTGRSMEQELGEGWAEGVHPDDLRPSLATYSEAFEARRQFRIEYRLRRHDGEYRWILDSGVPRFTPEGDFAGYIGSCVDITDHKRLEEALRESESKYRTLIEQASDAIFITNQQGNYLEANSKGCEMLGYEQEEIHRLTARDVFLSEGAASAPFPSEELRAGRSVLEERLLRRKDGTAVAVEVSSKILQDGRLLSIARRQTGRQPDRKA